MASFLWGAPLCAPRGVASTRLETPAKCIRTGWASTALWAVGTDPHSWGDRVAARGWRALSGAQVLWVLLRAASSKRREKVGGKGVSQSWVGTAEEGQHAEGMMPETTESRMGLSGPLLVTAPGRGTVALSGGVTDLPERADAVGRGPSGTRVMEPPSPGLQV